MFMCIYVAQKRQAFFIIVVVVYSEHKSFYISWKYEEVSIFRILHTRITYICVFVTLICIFQFLHWYHSRNVLIRQIESERITHTTFSRRPVDTFSFQFFFFENKNNPKMDFLSCFQRYKEITHTNTKYIFGIEEIDIIFGWMRLNGFNKHIVFRCVTAYMCNCVFFIFRQESCV